jgi:hypothetical protein
MKSTVFVFLFLSLAMSCSDCDEQGLEGNYLGTFYRVTNHVKGEISNVTLAFHDSKYLGTSSTPKYPALCQGTFTTSSNTATFTNTCPWTAEFDWTLILDGTFNLSVNGNEITLVKEYGDGNGDYYVLRRQ